MNVTFDPHLAEDLFYEIRERPESLPLLQFALDQLFKLREGRRLTRQSYVEIGGMKGAIDKHAEATYDKLPTPEHQIEARKLFTEYFIYIAEARDESSHLESGEGITRRRVTQVELQLDDSQPSTRSETIDAFVNARLLTATSAVKQARDQESNTEITYEIRHEALINAWERLCEWIKEDRKDIYLIQSLRSRIKQWHQEKKQKQKNGLLVEKSELQELQDYSKRKKLESPGDEFLKASLAQQQRQKIGRYILSIGITALVILSLVLGFFLRNVVFPDPTIVTSLADSGPGTLPYALQQASDRGTITFDARLGGQTISLDHNSLDIDKSITIRGPAGDINIISKSNTGNYIHIEPTRNVTIENMTFTNSYTLKHSMIVNAGNLTLNNCKMSGNKSYNDAGAIYNTGTLILNSDILEGNKVGTDGGAIHNLRGIVSINNSTISGNEAQGNGGGIYSQGGAVTVSWSHIENNRADKNAGGGIEIVNGSLSMNDTGIKSNHSDYTSEGLNGGFGGGIAIVGSVAFITTSVITANTASAKGGGIVVAKNTGNSSSSLVKLQDIISTNNHNAVYYIGQNTGGDIAGEPTTTGTNLQILDDPSIDNLGSPPPSSPVEKSPNYLGPANINTFCLDKGSSYGHISTKVDRNATDIMFTCFNQSNQAVGSDFSGQAICQSQYSESPGVNTMTDRLAEYFDPTSLQCYKNLQLLGPIGQAGFANYCASQPQYTGLFNDSKDRQTAYDWLCQPKDKNRLPTGLSVSDACNLQYNTTGTIDRLANFNITDGWECWIPATTVALTR